MPLQLLLRGFPDGAIRVGAGLSILTKEGMVTYFVGGDDYFSHAESDEASRRFILATLMHVGHVRACDLEREPLCIPHRTLMNWLVRLRREGPASFFQGARRGGGRVMTVEKVLECEGFFAQGFSLSEVAKAAGIGDPRRARYW